MPTLSNLTANPTAITVGGSITLSGNVNDVGALDTHQVVINWGDGSPATTINLAAGVTPFSASHAYNTSGNFNIGVMATDDDTGSATGGASVAVNPSLPPAAPRNLTATPVSKTQINLEWIDNSLNEDGFLIERCDGNGKCNNFVQIGQAGANVTTFANSGLTPGTFYTYRVRAFSMVGTSAYSNTVKARTPRN